MTTQHAGSGRSVGLVRRQARACCSISRPQSNEAIVKIDRPGIAANTRLVGIVVGLAVLGAVLAAVTESNLRGLVAPLVPNEPLDRQALGLPIVGGDAVGALALVPSEVRSAISFAVHHSIAAGFSAALAIGAIVALFSNMLSWLLIRAADTHPSKAQKTPASAAELRSPPCAVCVAK